MIFLKRLFIFCLFSFSTNSIYSQRYVRNQFEYTDGAPFFALTPMKIERASPTVGLSLGFETGGANLKFAFSILTTTARAEADDYNETAYSLVGGPDIQVACDSRIGFFNFGLNARYYFLDTEETIGSNFYAGAGVGFGRFSRKIIKGDYNDLEYRLENMLLDAFGTDIKYTSSTCVILSAGYEYSFESGFALIAGLGYNYQFDDNSINDYHDRLDVFTVSFGIKYAFLMDFQNMGGYPYRGF